jgi:hypothetical protein
MREILFRGKTEKGKWVYGDLLHPDLFGNGYAIDDFSIPKDNCFDVNPETIGQYTGLTDKNGKRIFEGDILEFNYVGENRGVNGIVNVVFKNGKFGVIWGWHEDFICLDGFANTTIEVIGNIHDNPELLEDSE